MMNGTRHGVLFDLDGTLVATEAIYGRATEAILEQYGRSQAELSRMERSQIPGRSAVENMRFYRDRFDLPDSPESLVALRLDRICRIVDEEGVPLTSGAGDLLAVLHRARFALAVASSAPRHYVDRVLDRAGIAGWFGAIVTGDDCERVKPFPEIFLRAADRLGLPPARCLVVEDAHTGILAGRAAGMAVLAVRSEVTLPEQSALADRVVDDFRGLGVDDVLGLIAGADGRRPTVDGSGEGP